jgi:hypothetical protein
MRTLKRNFLVTNENIRLNKINDFQVVRYFNPSHFDLVGHLIIHFDYSEGIGAENIRIEARYIDTSKSMEFYKSLEFFEEFKLPLSLGDITKQNEVKVSLKLKEDSKLLWKIGIQILPRTEIILHLSIT